MDEGKWKDLRRQAQTKRPSQSLLQTLDSASPLLLYLATQRASLSARSIAELCQALSVAFIFATP